MANTTVSTTDPLESFLEYIADVKPYHTKVYEVVLEYTYSEPVNVSIAETFTVNVAIATGSNLTPELCDMGWDSLSWDDGPWDYPYICDEIDPTRINATMTESFTLTYTDITGT